MEEEVQISDSPVKTIRVCNKKIQIRIYCGIQTRKEKIFYDEIPVYVNPDQAWFFMTKKSRLVNGGKHFCFVNKEIPIPSSDAIYQYQYRNFPKKMGMFSN